jgi:hypothetical protein
MVVDGCHCTCWRRTAFLVQCEHMLTIDKQFRAEKYDMRWFSESFLKSQGLEFRCDSISRWSPLTPTCRTTRLFPAGDTHVASSPAANSNALFASPRSVECAVIPKVNYHSLSKRMT